MRNKRSFQVIAIVVTFAVQLLWYIAGADLWGTVRATGKEIISQVHRAAPISIEIYRLEQLSDSLMPGINATSSAVAQLEVDIEYTQDRIRQLESGGSEPSPVIGAMKVYSYRQVGFDEISSQQRLLQLKLNALDLLKKRLDEQRSQRQELAERIVSLRASAAIVESLSSDNHDCSATFDAAMKLASELQQRVAVRQRLFEIEESN